MLDSVDDYIKAKLVHSIHTTERRSFRGCRRRWNWVFREFYYPTATAKPLEFGVAFHKAMEVLYEPSMWPDWEVSGALALTTFKKTVLDQYEAFKKLNGGDVDPEVELDYNERVNLGLGMLRNYIKNIMPIKDRNFKPVKVEIKFEVPITNPDDPNPETAQLWCRCDICWNRYKGWVLSHLPATQQASNPDVYWKMIRDSWKGLPVTYGGRIDMLAEDDNGEYWVFDWKTAAQLTATGENDHLLLDDQITSYCWALWMCDINVAGFVYAEIKKAFPQEPEPMKHRRLGRLYSTSKQNTYDYNSYRTTVEENDPEAFADGLYDDYFEYLQSNENRVDERHQITRNEAELHEAWLNIYKEALEITRPNLLVYPAPGRFACNYCAFQDPCLSANRREDFQYNLDTMYDKRRYHYYEDKEPSTEGKGGE